MAAVAQLSPQAFPSSSLPAAYQTAMLQQLESAMQSGAAGALHMPAPGYTHTHQHQLHQQQQQQALMPEFMSPHGGSIWGTPQGQRVMPSRHHTVGSDSATSSMGGNFMLNMSAHQSPYATYSLQQQQQRQQQQGYQPLGRFGSISQSPVALQAPVEGQMSSHLPVGSLEALRGGWHAPRGRNAYGDMFASSLTVPSQRLAGAASLAGSLGGSLAGSLGPPRLPPSLSNRPRHSFSTSPGGPILSPGSATPPTAAAPNRVFGFGSSAYADQQQAQQLQQQLPRQQSLQQRQHASPHHQHSQRQQQQQQPGLDHLERLYDDWAGVGAEGNHVRHMSRQPSLDAPHPSDWDPNFR